MPRVFRKKNFRRRRGKPWYKRAYNAMQVAQKAWGAAKYVRSLINVEKKVYDTAVSLNPSTTPSVLDLVAVAQGTAINERDGNSIKIRYLGGRFAITTNTSATAIFLRMMVIEDLQQVPDTGISIADVLTGVTPHSFLNINTLGRYKIHVDRVISLNTDANLESKYTEFNLNLQHHVRYNGTAATDLQKGGLYLVFFSDQAVNFPSVQGTARIRYVDN